MKLLEEGGGSEFYRHQVKEADATTSKGTLAVQGAKFKAIPAAPMAALAGSQAEEVDPDTVPGIWWEWQAKAWSDAFGYPSPERVTLFHALQKLRTTPKGLLVFVCRSCLRQFTFGTEPPGSAQPGYECPTHLAEGVNDLGTITVCWRRPKEARFVVPCRLSARERERLEELLRPKWKVVGGPWT